MTTPSAGSPPPPSHAGFVIGRRTFIAGLGAVLAGCSSSDGGPEASEAVEEISSVDEVPDASVSPADPGAITTEPPDSTAEPAPADPAVESTGTFGASGVVTIGSNFFNESAVLGLRAAIDAFPNAAVTTTLNEFDSFTFQDNISAYLQDPDDVIP